MSPAPQPGPSATPQPLPPVSRKTMESGLITFSAVSENRRPQSSVLESINFDFDQIGSAIVRPGLTVIGSNITNPILGMSYFSNTVAGGTSQLVVVAGTAAYYLNSGTFSTIRTGLTSGSRARFTTLYNVLFMVNGTEATATWDGVVVDGFVTTGNALNAPTGQFIEVFSSRAWIAGNSTYPDNIYFSTIGVPGSSIVWNTNTVGGQYLVVSPNDGETITALHRSRSALIVFKQNHMYRVFGIGQQDTEAFYTVGTYSQESVVETKAGCFFHHSSGFYQYNIYSIVVELSRPIIDIVKAIPQSAWPNVVGWLDPDGDTVNWSVGTITYTTAQGYTTTVTNCVVRYKISTQTFSHRSYTVSIVAAISKYPLYTDGTTQYGIVGDSGGNIYEYNTGNTDNGTEIPFSLIHNWDNIDGLLSTRKTVQTAMFSHRGGTGAKVAVQVENENTGIPPDSDWTNSIGSLARVNTGFNTMNLKGRKFRFRIYGSAKETFAYEGYELLDVVNEFVQFANGPTTN